MAQHYHNGLVMVSLVVAILASYTALTLAMRIRLAAGIGARAWLMGGGFAMGIGIWAMHFVGMLALTLPVQIAYDVWITLASMAIAVLVSTFALHIASRDRMTRGKLTAAGIAMGVGICAMHYAGMMAAHFPAAAVTHAGVNRAWLAGAVTIITAFVLLAALLLSLLEAQAAARTAKMQAIVAEATSTSRAKDEFLAMLGHELRNPLASIANAVVLMDRAAPGSADGRLARDVIARQAAHLGRIVDDLLDVGRAVAGKMSLNLQPVDLHNAVPHALGALAASGKTAQRRVDYRGAPCWVSADRTRLEQVVTNLVSNAVQHTGEQGRIRVEVLCASDEAEVRVSDDGAGMDEDTALHAFELFYQAEHGSGAGSGGLGIGLTLVRRIIELHGGSVRAESSGRGQGATFTVRLPRIAAPARAGGPERRSTPRPARSIVLVEDADDARQTLHRLLEAEGHRVCATSDGESGLRAILERSPDVAIVDIGLPGLDGYEVARRARSAGVNACLIALTGYGLAEDKRRASSAGFDLHLTKPAAVAEVLKAVAEASS